MLTLPFHTPQFFEYTRKFCYLFTPRLIFADRKIKMGLVSEAQFFFAWWSCFVSVRLLSPMKFIMLLLFIASDNLLHSQLRQNAIIQSYIKIILDAIMQVGDSVSFPSVCWTQEQRTGTHWPSSAVPTAAHSQRKTPFHKLPFKKDHLKYS